MDGCECNGEAAQSRIKKERAYTCTRGTHIRCVCETAERKCIDRTCTSLICKEKSRKEKRKTKKKEKTNQRNSTQLRPVRRQQQRAGQRRRRSSRIAHAGPASCRRHLFFFFFSHAVGVRSSLLEFLGVFSHFRPFLPNFTQLDWSHDLKTLCFSRTPHRGFFSRIAQPAEKTNVLFVFSYSFFHPLCFASFSRLLAEGKPATHIQIKIMF